MPDVPWRVVSVLHAFSVADESSPFPKGDRSPDHRREALADTILGRRCLSAVQHLFDWSTGVVATPQLDLSAELCAVIQDELRSRESPLDVEAGFELAYARRWTVLALVDSAGGVKRAKELELELTDGAPLAVCTGITWRKGLQYDPPPFLGTISKGVTSNGEVVRIPGFGCFGVSSAFFAHRFDSRQEGSGILRRHHSWPANQQNTNQNMLLPHAIPTTMIGPEKA